MSLKTDAGSVLFSQGDTKRQVDAVFADYFDQQIQQADLISPNYGQLWRSLSTVFQAGGKRLRPHLLLLIYKALSDKPSEDIFTAAMAQELLHLAMLVHDDIIDRDYIRHGVPNIAGQYQKQYAMLQDAQERNHFADSAALLAGDLLISQAHILLQKCNVSPQILDEIQHQLAQSIFYVTGGELLDTEASFMPNERRANATAIARYKTASYSFVGPLVMGAQLAEASQETIAKLEKLGSSLGIAYQLQDDLLGVFGDQELTGKSVDGDIREGKRTYLVEQFYEHATKQQIQEFEQIFHNASASANQLQKARQLLIESKAKQATIQQIEAYANVATDCLGQLNFKPQIHKAFTDIITMCTQRSQ